MKTLKIILEAIRIPMAMLCGVSVHRYFFIKDDNWLIPLIISSVYTIWYFYDLVKQHKKLKNN